MKKNLLLLAMVSFLVMSFGFQKADAQEEKKSKVHITITEDDKVTTDTTFELSEGQDPEMVKKMVMHLAGDDGDMVYIHKVHKMHDGDHKMVWISDDGEKNQWTAHSMSEGINIDSIKKAHGGKPVMVMKDKDGKITVKEVEKDHVMHLDTHGEHGEMMFFETDEDGEVIHIKKNKCGEKHKVIIHESEGKGGEKEMKVEVIVDGDDEDLVLKEKNVKVIVHADKDIEWESEDGKEGTVDVYVYETEDGEEVKVVKKKEVKVEIVEEDEEKAEKTGKKKKKK